MGQADLRHLLVACVILQTTRGTEQVANRFAQQELQQAAQAVLLILLHVNVTAQLKLGMEVRALLQARAQAAHRRQVPVT